MRFYEGYVYSLSPAVDIKCEDFNCRFLNIKSPRTAFIDYGYERLREVGADSKMLLYFRDKNGKWHEKIAKIPFTKTDGELKFDYPGYLKESGIPFRLYKKTNISYYSPCDANYHMIYCKNADITYGNYYDSCFEWYYDSCFEWFGIDYKKPLLFLNGRQVTYIEITDKEICKNQLIDFVKAHLEEKYALSYAELAAVAARFHIRKDNFSQVRFSDGTIYRNKAIDWNDTEI